LKLVVVESPAKAKTIEKYLGPGHRVLASYGHVRDLPAKDGSVDPDQDFAMEWQVSADKTRQLKAITDEAKDAEVLVLATDPDREGEAISWHLAEVLKKRKALPPKVVRVAFNAITKSAVTEAMANPRELDENLIDAYRARRALDYLVGFTLSPILWRKLPGAKSAGRVQSVALRLIVDREREIELFRPREYWSVTATFDSGGQGFQARLVEFDGKKIERLTIGDKGEADQAKAAVESGRFTVSSVETKPFAKNPPPPFTTSTLQQEAARKLGFAASHTMRVAQGLYEQGAITYMRTDGIDMAGEAISAARRTIAERYDAGYVPDRPRNIHSKAKNAQEAHEAIRPTDFSAAKAGLGRSFAAVRADLQPGARKPDGIGAARTDDGRAFRRGRAAVLRATGQVVLFPGFSRFTKKAGRKARRRGGRPDAGAARGRCSAKTGVEATPAFHPAAAALFRSKPGQAARGAGDRQAFDLCVDPPDAEGPRICAGRESALRSRGKRPAGNRLPRAVLREICELRLHRRARGGAGRRLRRPARLAAAARRVLARFPAQGRRGDGAETVRDHRRDRRISRTLALPAARGRKRPAGCARNAATEGCRFAAAASARSSPAPIIRNANSPSASGRPAPSQARGRATSARASS
jgi:hypothetical protein